MDTVTQPNDTNINEQETHRLLTENERLDAALSNLFAKGGLNLDNSEAIREKFANIDVTTVNAFRHRYSFVSNNNSTKPAAQNLQSTRQSTAIPSSVPAHAIRV